MKEKMHPAYLTKTVQRMYRNTKCTLQDGRRTGSKHINGSNRDMVKDLNEIWVYIFRKIWQYSVLSLRVVWKLRLEHFLSYSDKM